MTACGFVVSDGRRCEYEGWWNRRCYWHHKVEAMANGGLPTANVHARDGWISADALVAADGTALSEWVERRLLAGQICWLTQLSPEEVEWNAQPSW